MFVYLFVTFRQNDYICLREPFTIDCRRLWHHAIHPVESRGNYSATSNNMVIGTLAVDGWAVTFGTAMRELGGYQT